MAHIEQRGSLGAVSATDGGSVSTGPAKAALLSTAPAGRADRTAGGRPQDARAAASADRPPGRAWAVESEFGWAGDRGSQTWAGAAEFGMPPLPPAAATAVLAMIRLV